MTSKIKKHLDQVLGHLYINPLEKCNLNCRICYTRKTSPILSSGRILEFISRYRKVHKLETITFCGGEVFTLPYFTAVVNELTKQGIFVQIITNGTIDRLDDFRLHNFINCIVSLDGLAEYHDSNRGKGNFGRSISYLKHAKSLGCHIEIFSIVTRQNYHKINDFEKYLSDELEILPNITYHPRKPLSYLINHPVSNISGIVNGFDFLKHKEITELLRTRNTFPPKNLGCYQIALMSDGKVYGCCEGIVPIGNIDSRIIDLFNLLTEKIEQWEKVNMMKGCLGCSQTEFMCGIKQYIVNRNFIH
jgi:MoaA/NifB/PqqE/SkfB family radical SAM enzyme